MRRAIAVVFVLLTAALTPLAGVTGAAADTAQGSLVGVVPVNGTPHVLNGQVNSIAQVGNTMFLGGTFTQAQNNGGATVTRNRILAFDKTTKQLSTTFVPNFDAAVEVILPAADGTTLYVGGQFRNVNGVALRALVRINISDGSLVTSFNPQPVAGSVLDLKLQGSRLWVAGNFTNIANRNQRALATLNPNTGARTTFYTGVIAGTHRTTGGNIGQTTVLKIDVTPQADRLIAIGNFDTLDGVKRHQMLMLDTSGATAVDSGFKTTFYEAACSTSFQTYLRDVDISPDGEFGVVSTTGAYGGTTSACDTTARWETRSAGADVRPSWINTTGGDTTYAVEVTDSVVYTGGHARWQNNPFAADDAAQGAVSREGIAALDPANGLPYSWNPTRDRGVGVFDFLHTADGLWVGSDTDRIGADYYRAKIALLPSAGSTIPAQKDAALPSDVYLGYPLGTTPAPAPTLRVNAGGPQIAGTPVWQSDSSGNGYHNGLLSRNSYTQVGSVDSTVPAGTPVTLFSSDLTGALLAPNINWNIPVTSGQTLDVRLYFANRSTSTQNVGQRRFHVDLEGTRVLNNFDVVAATGHNRGTMRSFQITSDGNIDLDLQRISGASYPMISGIEVMQTPPTPPPANPILRRAFDGAAAGADVVAAPDGRNWANVRGAFMLNGQLYTAWNDGSFVKQSYDGTTFGPTSPVNTGGQLVAMTDWSNDIKAATSMFYDRGRIYFTLGGDNNLYYRYFTPESDVVGALRWPATASVPGVTFSAVRGAFVAGNSFYFADNTAQLTKMDWARGPIAGAPAGAASVVSGPGVDGKAWSARALWVYQGFDGSGTPQVPVAAFTSDCQSVTCTFDGSGSTSVNAAITNYQWNFGDGNTASGATPPAHTYAGSGNYTVTLTVTNSAGLTDDEVKQVSVTKVNQPPTAAFTEACNQLACTFDASGSSDPDGEPLTYSWDFGDGGSATGATPQHTYAAAGTYPVTVTVSDGAASDAESHNVIVVQAAVAFVDAASTAGNKQVHTVTVPATVQAGDTLLLFTTVNSAATITDPAGWTVVQNVTTGNAVNGRVWSKTATATDAGATVTVNLSMISKATVSVAGYRNPGGAVAVTASDQRVYNATTSTVATPVVNVSAAGSWLVSYFSEKSAVEPMNWTLPGGVTQRTAAAAVSAGKVSSVTADSNGSVPAGTAGGLEATTSGAVSRAISFSIVLAPQ